MATRKASRKASRKARRIPTRQRRRTFKAVDVVTEGSARPLKPFLVDFRFLGHVPIDAESLEDAVKRAQDLTVVEAWQRSQKYRLQIAGVFTPDDEHAKIRADEIGR